MNQINDIKIEQICSKYIDNTPIAKIARAFNISEKKIKNILHEKNILKPYFLSSIPWEHVQKLLDKEFILQKFSESKSNEDFFKKINVKYCLGKTILKFHSLKRINISKNFNEENIIKLYFDGFAREDILKELKMSRTAFENRLSKNAKKILNFKIPSGKIKNREIIKIIRNNDRARLIDIINKFKSMAEITEYIGCQYITFYKILKKFNIDKPKFNDPRSNKKIKELNYHYSNYNIINLNGDSYDVIHCKCGKKINLKKQVFYRHSRKNSESLCPFCYNKYKTSIAETEVCNFLSSLNINYVKNDRTATGDELDILIPDKKIAIEYNGLYWHCDVFKDKKFHQNKYLNCYKNNIQLISIFEDEWQNKQEIVKTILKHKLKLNTNKIYARNTYIVDISTEIYKEFLEKFHIQGYSAAIYRYGLFDDNNLVAVLGISKPNISTGHKDNSILEIKRFATSINVVGGFSKLLNNHVKNVKNDLITYTDLRYGNGDVYLKNGFIFDKMTAPNYWWVKGQRRFHRYNFAKHKLIKLYPEYKEMTEDQIMRTLKYNKIYDCGSNKFIFKSK